MRYRTLLTAGSLAVTLAATSVLAPSPAYAESDPICTGTPTNPATYVCVVHAHVENGVPVFYVDTIAVIPEVCVLNACPGPTPVEVPLFEPATAPILVLWNNNTCHYVLAGGSVVSESGHPLVNGQPDCPEEP